jgi:hypothetical protein
LPGTNTKKQAQQSGTDDDGENFFDAHAVNSSTVSSS